MESNTDKFKINIQMDTIVDVLGVIMSYYGWNGKDDFQAASKLLGTLIALRCAGINKNLLIDLNDSGLSFDEIADYLDKIGGSKYWR
jgi:hypothetical protein